MNKEFILAWDNNKNILEEVLKDIQIDTLEYKSLVKLIIVNVINSNIDDEYNHFDEEKIHVIDDGIYQGTQLFIIPKKTYQPSDTDYIITNVDYGSCSGCDTLERIRDYEYGKPNDTQLKDLMILCLHLVQRMKYIYEQ